MTSQQRSGDAASAPTAVMARKIPGVHPLGPRFRWAPLEKSTTGRLYALGVLAFVIAVLTAAWRIDPGMLRMGAHRQLGLPPCGFLTITGFPCPTCGMTTAFAHTVHGHPAAAIASQLAGFILAVGTIVAGLLAIVAVVTGRKPAINWYRINPMRVVWWGAAIFVLAWGLKMGLGLLDGSLPARGAR